MGAVVGADLIQYAVHVGAVLLNDRQFAGLSRSIDSMKNWIERDRIRTATDLYRSNDSVRLQIKHDQSGIPGANGKEPPLFGVNGHPGWPFAWMERPPFHNISPGDVNPAAFLKTISAYNAAVTRDVKFDPNIKDGRRTVGLAIDKTNWANTMEKPPFEAYSVGCGITFTFGGLKIDTAGHVMIVDPREKPADATISQLEVLIRRQFPETKHF